MLILRRILTVFVRSQDHLYTGWYTRPHRDLVQKHLDNIRSGKQHAPWKDDVWGQNHDTPEEDQENMPMDSSASPKGKGRGFVLRLFLVSLDLP